MFDFDVVTGPTQPPQSQAKDPVPATDTPPPSEADVVTQPA